MTHDTPTELRYSKEHEWVRVQGDEVTIGITDFAQDALTDVVYVDLPGADASHKVDAVLCVVESVKSVSDIYMPVSGTVVKVNDRLADEPGLINSDPYGDGWIAVIRMDDPAELDALMSAKEYAAFTAASH